MIEPLKAVVDKHVLAQGWDTDSVEHVLLLFLANASGSPAEAAADLDTFLTDLAAPEEETESVVPDPRERCYAHLEALQTLLTAGDYEPRPAAWAALEALLGRTVRRALRARRLGGLQTDAEAAHPPAFAASLSVPIPQEIGRLSDADERAIRDAFDRTPGTTFDGTGAGLGYREFFAATTDPASLAEALEPFLVPGAGLAFNRREPGDA